MDERDYKAMNDELKSDEEILFKYENRPTGWQLDDILQAMEEYADQFKKQLEYKDKLNKGLAQTANFYRDQIKEKEEEIEEYTKALRKAEEQLTKSNEMNERLAEALESSVNGLVWFQEEYPSSYSKNDAEHLTKCKDALTEYQNSKK